MPTNEFQELVRLLEQSLHSSKAKITCPAMVQAQGLEGFREVDILIEDKLGPCTIKIAVEATDLGKKMALPKYDSLAHKYLGAGRVGVNKLIIVTRLGYSADVMEKAALEGVELVTLDEVKNADWPELVRRPMRIETKGSPYICTIGFKPEVPGATPRDLFKEAKISCSHGADFGLAIDYLRKYLHNVLLKVKPNALKDLEERAKQPGLNGAHATFEFKPSHQFFVVFRGQRSPVDRMWLILHKDHRKGTGEMRCYDRRSSDGTAAKILHTKASDGRMTIETAMEFIRDGKRLIPPKSITVRLKTDHPTTAEDKKKQRDQRKKEAKQQGRKKKPPKN
jgi:hypothetical protein